MSDLMRRLGLGGIDWVSAIATAVFVGALVLMVGVIVLGGGLSAGPR